MTIVQSALTTQSTVLWILCVQIEILVRNRYTISRWAMVRNSFWQMIRDWSRGSDLTRRLLCTSGRTVADDCKILLCVVEVMTLASGGIDHRREGFLSQLQFALPQNVCGADRTTHATLLPLHLKYLGAEYIACSAYKSSSTLHTLCTCRDQLNLS